jgi:hypothetical protein
LKKLLALSFVCCLLSGTVVGARNGPGGQVSLPDAQRAMKNEFYWANLGVGLLGLMGAFSYQSGILVYTAHVAGYGGIDDFSILDIGGTVGIALTKGRFLIAAGAGPGMMRGEFSQAGYERSTLCLDMDFQLFFRFGRHVGLGIYYTRGVNSIRTMGRTFVSLQFGRLQR